MRVLTGLALASMVTGCVGPSDTANRAPVRPPGISISQTPQGRACFASLGAAKVNFTPMADRTYGVGCNTFGTVRIGWLQGDAGRLEVANLGPVSCPVANSLQQWARFGVDRAARQILGSPLARIETMGSYSCRKVAGTNRLSAHATANAIDVSAFRLADGRRISVLGDWYSSSPQTRAFLRTIRDSACKRFGTVLTPEYNAAHRDHLHLEPGGLRPLCR